MVREPLARPWAWFQRRGESTVSAMAADVHEEASGGGSLLATMGRPMIGSTLTGIAGQAGLLVSGILVARMLSVGDRGYVALLAVIPAIIVQVGTLGLPMALTYHMLKSPRSTYSTVRRLAPWLLVLGVAQLLVGLLAAELVTRGRSAELGPVALASALYIPPAIALQFGLATLQGLQSYRWFNLLRLAPALCYAALACLLFLFDFASVVAVLSAWVLAQSMPAAVVWVIVWRAIRHLAPGAKGPRLASLLRFGLRGLIGSLAPLEMLGVDQLVVGLLLSPGALGMYVVASSLCNLPRLIAQSLGLVAYPHVASLDRPAARKRTVEIVIVASVVLACTVLGLVATAAVVIPLVFSSKYGDAVPIAQVLLGASLIFGVRRVLIDCLRGTGRPGDGTIAEILGWFVFAALLMVPTRALSAEGVAWVLAGTAAVSLAALAGLGWLGLHGRGSVGPRAAPLTVSRG